MVPDTTQRITVELGYATAQALWAAMHDDDSLVADYFDLAIIHALNHLLDDCDSRWWTNDNYARITKFLGVAKSGAILREDDMVQRFMVYCEPPF